MAIKKLRGRNEGSISHRYNGTYRAQLSYSGKRISASFRTKAEAQKWLRDQLLKLERGFDFQGSKITLGKYLPEWLEMRTARLPIVRKQTISTVS